MIPPIPPSGSENEKFIYELLRCAPGTEDWVILHQVKIAEHMRQQSGEADMIVLVPNVGCLFLEIKGYVTVSNGLWFYGNSQVGSIRSPMEQASNAMYSVLKWLKKHGHQELTGFTYASAAVFVKTHWSTQLLEFSSKEIIDATSLDHAQPTLLVNAVLSAIRCRTRPTEDRNRFDKPPIQSISRKTIEQFVATVRPAVHPPKLVRNLLRAQVVEHTSDQLDALDECAGRKQVIFKGLAGTGKSVLAVEAAHNFAAAGNHVLLICNNELAREQLKSAAIGVERLSIKGVMELAYGAVPSAVRKQLIDQARWNELLDKATSVVSSSRDHRKYDVLIIDEAQDVMTSGAISFLDGLLEGGLKDGRWFMFLDPNQLLSTSGRGCLEDFEREHRDAYSRPLLANCRNTISIARFANAVARLNDPLRYDTQLVRNRSSEHPKPELVFYDSVEEQSELVMQRMLSLIDQGVEPQDIVLLSGKKENSCAHLLVERGYNDLLEPFTHRSSKKIRYETVHRFKGLESFYAILTDIDQLPEDLTGVPLREMLYVGVTRANIFLACYVCSRIRDEFEKGLALGGA